MNGFKISRLPELIAGEGMLEKLPSIAARFGPRILLITGQQSFTKTRRFDALIKSFGLATLDYRHAVVVGEPSPDLINQIVTENRPFSISGVVAIGGGSVIDTGKAVSAMLPSGLDVRNYLEGVGTEIHDGRKVPFIAIPTTAGTGSEATKNAVLSDVGKNGFKRSLRHENFIPEVAILDPSLCYSCPPQITLASGLDALTQLMEAFLSVQANPFADALAVPAINSIVHHLPVVLQEPAKMEARFKLCIAAYYSGICLANAGLGTVHGFASAIGSMVEIPHGVVCGLLMKSTHLKTFHKVKTEGALSWLEKYQLLADIINSHSKQAENPDFSVVFDRWMGQFNLPGLSAYGINEAMFTDILQKTDQKNNPARLDKEDLSDILYSCL